MESDDCHLVHHKCHDCSTIRMELVEMKSGLLNSIANLLAKFDSHDKAFKEFVVTFGEGYGGSDYPPATAPESSYLDNTDEYSGSVNNYTENYSPISEDGVEKKVCSKRRRVNCSITGPHAVEHPSLHWTESSVRRAVSCDPVHSPNRSIKQEYPDESLVSDLENFDSPDPTAAGVYNSSSKVETDIEREPMESYSMETFISTDVAGRMPDGEGFVLPSSESSTGCVTWAHHEDLGGTAFAIEAGRFEESVIRPSSVDESMQRQYSDPNAAGSYSGLSTIEDFSSAALGAPIMTVDGQAVSEADTMDPDSRSRASQPERCNSDLIMRADRQQYSNSSSVEELCGGESSTAATSATDFLSPEPDQLLSSIQLKSNRHSYEADCSNSGRIDGDGRFISPSSEVQSDANEIDYSRQTQDCYGLSAPGSKVISPSGQFDIVQSHIGNISSCQPAFFRPGVETMGSPSPDIEICGVVNYSDQRPTVIADKLHSISDLAHQTGPIGNRRVKSNKSPNKAFRTVMEKDNPESVPLALRVNGAPESHFNSTTNHDHSSIDLNQGDPHLYISQYYPTGGQTNSFASLPTELAAIKRQSPRPLATEYRHLINDQNMCLVCGRKFTQRQVGYRHIREFHLNVNRPHRPLLSVAEIEAQAEMAGIEDLVTGPPPAPVEGTGGVVGGGIPADVAVDLDRPGSSALEGSRDNGAFSLVESQLTSGQDCSS